MRLWFLVKLIALFAVLGVMGFTGMLAYHIMVQPLGGIFEKIIPNPTEMVKAPKEEDVAKMLDSADLPDIDPGEKTFQKAHELVAMGHFEDAREKLTAIVNVFPGSPCAPIARRIVGDMNMDEILSTAFKQGKQSHIVKRGDSFLGIAGKYQTTLDAIMYFNGMTEFGNIQPGDELIVVPLNFRLLIEPQRNSISIWDSGKFIREYPILRLDVPAKLANQKIKIDSKAADLAGKRIAPNVKGYRGAPKIIQLSKVQLAISQFDPADKEPGHGIFISGPDMEELNLLTRTGNEVEIRNPTR